MPSTSTRKRRAPTKVAAPPAPDPADELRLERWWTAGVVAIAAVVVLAGFSSNIQFGDSAESVSGVEGLGILHAPGYVAYVLAAKLFTLLVPFGNAAFQVNLFSVAVSLAAVGVAYRCGRRLGAERAGAAVGALTLATGLSFWYYATYAKAYALTTLLLLGSLYLLLAWKQDGGMARLVGAFAVLGFASGASYQVVLLAVPGLAVLVFGKGRRPTASQLLSALGVGVAVVVALLGFTLVRSGQDPAVSWGGAHTPSRLVDLVRMRDFGFGTKGTGSGRLVLPQGEGAGTPGAAGGGGGGGGGGLLRPRAIVRAPFRLVTYPTWVLRDIGFLLTPLAAVGLVSSIRRRSPGWLALIVIAAGNVMGSAMVVGGGGRRLIRFRIPNASNIISLGGFLLAATAVVCLWVGLGAAAVLAWARNEGSSKMTGAERRRRERAGKTAAERVPRPFVLALLGIALIVTAAINYGETEHRTPAYAKTYAANVFRSIPKGTVLLTWVAERSFALEEQQLVDGRRTDVDVVRLEQINQPWYREQLNDRLGVHLPLQPKGNQFEEGAALAEQLRSKRPVFLDHAALYYTNRTVPDLGFSQRGLVAEVVDGKGQQAPDLKTMDRLFGGELALDHLADADADKWPNDDMLLAYSYALIDYGAALTKVERFEDAIEPFELAVQIDPDNIQAQQSLDALRRKVATG